MLLSNQPLLFNNFQSLCEPSCTEGLSSSEMMQSEDTSTEPMVVSALSELNIIEDDAPRNMPEVSILKLLLPPSEWIGALYLSYLPESMLA